MKRILAILGVVFLILLVALGVFIVRVAATGSKLDASSKAFVDETVPQIVGTWSADNLIQHAAPQLLQATSEDQVQELFRGFAAKLGPLVQYEGCKGESNTSVTTQSGRVVSARYTAQATFQNGKATINLTLLQNTSSTWSIVEFYVLSPTLVH
jgi:hypothetical protein